MIFDVIVRSIMETEMLTCVRKEQSEQLTRITQKHELLDATCLPGSSFAISDHLFPPNFACASMMILQT
jgi:hypothetical protein